MPNGLIMTVKREDGTIVLPAQGDEQTNVADSWIDAPGVGTHTYTFYITYTYDASFTDAHSLRRALTALVVLQ